MPPEPVQVDPVVVAQELQRMLSESNMALALARARIAQLEHEAKQTTEVDG